MEYDGLDISYINNFNQSLLKMRDSMEKDIEKLAQIYNDQNSLVDLKEKQVLRLQQVRHLKKNNNDAEIIQYFEEQKNWKNEKKTS